MRPSRCYRSLQVPEESQQGVMKKSGPPRRGLWKSMKKQKHHRRTCSNSVATTAADESVSSSNSLSGPLHEEHASPETMAQLRLQLMGVSMNEQRGPLHVQRSDPCHGPGSSRVDQAPFANPLAAARSSGPVDVDDFYEVFEEEEDCRAPAYKGPVCIDDSGPVDVDDYIPCVEEASQERESYDSFDSSDFSEGELWIDDDDDEFSRSLTGYEHGFEPVVEREVSSLFPEHRRAQSSPWNKYLGEAKSPPRKHRSVSESAGLRQKSFRSVDDSTISSKSTFFEC